MRIMILILITYVGREISWRLCKSYNFQLISLCNWLSLEPCEELRWDIVIFHYNYHPHHRSNPGFPISHLTPHPALHCTGHPVWLDAADHRWRCPCCAAWRWRLAPSTWCWPACRCWATMGPGDHLQGPRERYESKQSPSFHTLPNISKCKTKNPGSLQAYKC